jgi:hypothetical protein
MGAPTFAQALEQAAQLARTAMPTRVTRIDQAVTLVKEGRVFQRGNGEWEVDSMSTAGLRHAVNGSCDCADAHYRGDDGPCKHQMAVYLSRKIVKLMHPAVAPQTPAAPHEPVRASVSPLPEAPCSINFRAMIGGFETQVTLRDTDESRLLARLQALLTDQRIRPVPKPAPRAAGQQWKQRRQYQGRA